jgi:hypothetical protein
MFGVRIATTLAAGKRLDAVGPTTRDAVSKLAAAIAFALLAIAWIKFVGLCHGSLRFDLARIKRLAGMNGK